MSIGGGDYGWVQGDCGYYWVGPGPAPGCGPGCCGGCRTRPLRNMFQVPPDETLTELLLEGKKLGDSLRNDFDKVNRCADRPVPNILSNYVTKQELQDALNELRGICGDSIDKENSARCDRPKGHFGFCERLRGTFGPG